MRASVGFGLLASYVGLCGLVVLGALSGVGHVDVRDRIWVLGICLLGGLGGLGLLLILWWLTRAVRVLNAQVRILVLRGREGR